MGNYATPDCVRQIRQSSVPLVGSSSCRGRRRLAPRGLELLFQPFVFAPQPIGFDLRPLQILALPLDFVGWVVDDLLRVTGRRIHGAASHATVMPDSRAQYKEQLRVFSVVRDQREGRSARC
jgi:hypothetical protein